MVTRQALWLFSAASWVAVPGKLYYRNLEMEGPKQALGEVTSLALSTVLNGCGIQRRAPGMGSGGNLYPADVAAITTAATKAAAQVQRRAFACS